MLEFQITQLDTGSGARRGRLATPRAVVETPVFMPIGTQGSVKALSQQEVASLGYRLILGNTYHLHLRPGEELIRRAGGLHRFIGWDGAILTDSGGFQIFSLESRRRISDEGVLFRSHIDGSEHLFTPENVVDIQAALGSDIMMALDECPPYPCDRERARVAMERTHVWARRALEHWQRRCSESPRRVGIGALFGIVQGSVYPELRAESAAVIGGMPFPGVAIGGVSVGEPRELIEAVIQHTAPLLPAHKPRYLMGLGTPRDLLEAVAAGVDMFDCVLPTRLGRNGSAYTSRGRINLKAARFTEDFGPIDPECDAWCCRHYAAAYIRHLYKAGEILAARILTYHNLAFYARLMEGIRAALDTGTFSSFRAEWLNRLRDNGSGDDAGA
ncbi:MAG: tRNA guanosine(34) transglycosylase Tgt [Armatimonadetes bacterium]|nr:tRNA guanosine(34) transglycosylase Tgt [Armatimonadota bacterium]